MTALTAKPVKSNSLKASLRQFASCIFGSFKTVNGHSLCGEGDITVSPRGAAAIIIEAVEHASGEIPYFSKGCSYTLVFDTTTKSICLKVFNKSDRTASYAVSWPGMEAVCDSDGMPWEDVVYVAEGHLWLWDGNDLKQVRTESGEGSGIQLSRLGGLMFDPVSGALGVNIDGISLKITRTTGSIFVNASALDVKSLVPAASSEEAGLMSPDDKSKLDGLSVHNNWSSVNPDNFASIEVGDTVENEGVVLRKLPTGIYVSDGQKSTVFRLSEGSVGSLTRQYAAKKDLEKLVSTTDFEEAIENVKGQIPNRILINPADGEVAGFSDAEAVYVGDPMKWGCIPPDFTLPWNALDDSSDLSTPFTEFLIISGLDSLPRRFPVSGRSIGRDSGNIVLTLAPVFDQEGNLVVGHVTVIPGTSLRFEWTTRP